MTLIKYNHDVELFTSALMVYIDLAAKRYIINSISVEFRGIFYIWFTAH